MADSEEIGSISSEACWKVVEGSVKFINLATKTVHVLIGISCRIKTYHRKKLQNRGFKQVFCGKSQLGLNYTEVVGHLPRLFYEFHG